MNKKIFNGTFWNTLASGLMALQSIAMLMVITRIGKIEDAGIFAFGFSNANLFLHLGRFGMRNYQSSDVFEKYSFNLYRKTRAVTVCMMIMSCSLFIIIGSKVNGYSEYKSLMIFLLCIMKAVDAYEDVYHGNYQQHGYLDLAARLLTERIIISFVVFLIDLVICRDVNHALIISILASVLFVVLEVFCVRRKINLPTLKKKDTSYTVRKILLECVPLFLTAFFSFMIVNIPKYAIDFYLDDSDQAIFGFLFAPVFVLSVLVNSIFQPYVFELAILWNEKKYRMFFKLFRKQEIIVIGLIAVCMLGTALLGIPLLQIIYKVVLEQYKIELIVLMFGSGFHAFASLYIIGITTCRHHKFIGYIYCLLGGASIVVAFVLVKNIGMKGAVLSYTLLMFIEALVTLIVFYKGKRSLCE